MVLPLKADSSSQAHLVTLNILKVLPFNVQTLKSGVVVKAKHGPDAGLLFVRGAAGVIKSMVQPGSVPQDFDKVQGYRHSADRIACLLAAWLQEELQMPHDRHWSQAPNSEDGIGSVEKVRALCGLL